MRIAGKQGLISRLNSVRNKKKFYQTTKNILIIDSIGVRLLFFREVLEQVVIRRRSQD